MHHHQTGIVLRDQAFHFLEHARGDVAQCLPRRHQIEVNVRFLAENRKNLVEHLAVLAGCDDFQIDFGQLPQGAHNGQHLDRFGPGADHKQYGRHLMRADERVWTKFNHAEALASLRKNNATAAFTLPLVRQDRPRARPPPRAARPLRSARRRRSGCVLLLRRHCRSAGASWNWSR